MQRLNRRQCNYVIKKTIAIDVQIKKAGHFLSVRLFIWLMVVINSLFAIKNLGVCLTVYFEHANQTFFYTR